MKNLGISIIVMSLIIGCGSSSSSKAKSTDLDFNITNAKYDLIDYLQVDSLVTFKNKAYTKSGTAEYLEPIETYPTQKSKKVSNVITLKDAIDKETGTIKILSNKIERTFNMGDTSNTIDVVRNFNVGDYITNSELKEKALDAELKLNRICEVTNIVESKKVTTTDYENLLEIKCKTSSELLKETEQVKKAEITKIETIYMVKGKGIVSNENEQCTSITSVILEVENTVKKCNKNIKEMVSFNKL
jgi:hypothetical protein